MAVMTRSVRQRLYWIGLGLGGLFFFLQMQAGYQAITQHVVEAPAVSVLATAWGLVVVALSVQMAAWSRLMQELGVRLPWRQVIRGYMLSFIPRYVPGGVWGYVSRSQWLHQSHQVAYSLSHFGSILEVLAALVSAGLVVGLYAASTSAGIVQIALVGVSLLLPLVSWSILKGILVWPRFQRLLADRVPSSASLPQVGLSCWTLVVVMYVVLWLCYGGLVSLLLSGFKIVATAGAVIGSSVFMFAVSWLVGFFTVFVPAGLGVREVTLSSLMIGVIGMMPGQASLVSVMSRLVMSVSEVSLILFGLIIGKQSK